MSSAIYKALVNGSPALLTLCKQNYECLVHEVSRIQYETHHMVNSGTFIVYKSHYLYYEIVCTVHMYVIWDATVVIFH